eukprot:g4665.t1
MYRKSSITREGWEKFKRIDVTVDANKSMNDRKMRAEKLYKRRELVSELYVYIVDNEELLELLFKNISRDSDGNVDVRQFHGYLCATKALDCTPQELKKVFLKVQNYGPVRDLDAFFKALKKYRYMLANAARPLTATATRQNLRPPTAKQRDAHNKPLGETEAGSSKIAAVPKLSLSRQGKEKSKVSSVPDSVPKLSLSQQGQKKSKVSSAPGLAKKKEAPTYKVGKWEREELPFRGRLTKPALGYAFKYTESKTKPNDYLDERSVDEFAELLRKEQTARNERVFTAKLYSSRLKKKVVARLDEERILGYLEEWMDTKYLRIRDAFLKIDKDGSGELDIKEFGEMCVSMGLELSNMELEWVFSRIDTDGSKEISFHEFDTHIRAQRQKLAMLRNDRRVGGDKGDRTVYAKRDRGAKSGTDLVFQPPMFGSYRY